MDLNRALGDIAAIRKSLGRQTRFEGYSAIGIACSGVFAFLGIVFSETVTLGSSISSDWHYVIVWSLVLVFSLLCNGAGIYWNVRVRKLVLAQSNALAQAIALCPALVAGGLFSIALIRIDLFFLLPIVWMMHFGLALVSMRGIGPKQIEWVGGYLVLCSLYGLFFMTEAQILSPYYVGSVFTIAQCCNASLVWCQDVKGQDDF